MARHPTPEEIKLWRAAMSGANSHEFVSLVKLNPSLPLNRLDLHGLSVHQAHAKTLHYLTDGYYRGLRVATVITGKSGLIRQEFARWLEPLVFVQSLNETVRGGAFLIRLKSAKR